MNVRLLMPGGALAPPIAFTSRASARITAGTVDGNGSGRVAGVSLVAGVTTTTGAMVAFVSGTRASFVDAGVETGVATTGFVSSAFESSFVTPDCASGAATNAVVVD